MQNLKIVCPCHFGLEGILAGEMKRLGLLEVHSDDGKVSFTGGFEDVARANINLRTAERVLIELASFHADSFEDLFQGVRAIAWEEFIGSKEAFPVKGWSLNSQLHSVPDCQAIIKKAVVNRLAEKYNLTWFEETGATHQIQFSILKDRVSIMLDTSGAGLHKRGYRKNANEAPIKETLAAGIIDIARVRSDTQFYDPMCGSGTFLIEAAMKALKIAPGINRRFAAEKWGISEDAVWKNAREQAISKVERQGGFMAFGSDIDEDAISLVQENAKKAGIGSRIRAFKADVRDFSAQGENSVVVCNPPYGERLLDIKNAEKLYQIMGEAFLKNPEPNYYIITPHEEFERLFGKPASRRRKLYNGMIKCQLYMYY